MKFSEWILIREGGKGSGPPISPTGFLGGGQAKAAVGMIKPAKPHTKLVRHPLSKV
jgi:hypothetical protein